MQGCCTAFIQSCDDGAKKQRTVAVRCLQICLLDAAGFKKLVLAGPELFGQVYEVGLRVLEALDLVPEGVHLTHAVVANLVDGGRLVDALAVLEDLLTQRTNGVVGHDALLPRMDGVE